MDMTTNRAQPVSEFPSRRSSAAPTTNPMRVGAPSMTATGWASTAAVALALFAAAGSPAIAATISSVTWSTQSSQLLSKSNAGSLTPGSTPITVGYSTGYGNGGGGGSQIAGTTNLAVNWNLYNPTNAFNATDSVTTALRIGFGSTDNTTSASNKTATSLQTFTFSQAVTNPYIYMTYVQGGVVYDFSAYTTTVIDSGGVAFSVPSSSGAATGRTVTGSFNTDSPNAGFILQLTGSFTQIQFNVDSSGWTGAYFSSIMTIAAPLTASSVPGAGLAGLATVGLAGMSRRRRR